MQKRWTCLDTPLHMLKNKPPSPLFSYRSWSCVKFPSFLLAVGKSEEEGNTAILTPE